MLADVQRRHVRKFDDRRASMHEMKHAAYAEAISMNSIFAEPASDPLPSPVGRSRGQKKDHVAWHC
jgi:hypothetical protein